MYRFSPRIVIGLSPAGCRIDTGWAARTQRPGMPPARRRGMRARRRPDWMGGHAATNTARRLT
jgi:hypothetical protein